MVATLEQQNFPNPLDAPAVFASDPSATVEKPGNPYYQDGVAVGYTAPAKWWNWLWNHISAWLKDSKSDRDSINTEIVNTLSAASVSPYNADTRQLSKAISIISYNACEDYDNEEITETIGGVEVTHKKNQPYVIGFTVYIPTTELL